MVGTPSTPKVEQLDVSAYTVPTETPEADGTLAWRETTLVLVRALVAAPQDLDIHSRTSLPRISSTRISNG